MRTNLRSGNSFNNAEHRIVTGIFIVVMMIFIMFIDDTSHSPENCDFFCRLSDNGITRLKIGSIGVMLPFLVWALTGWVRIVWVMGWLLIAASFLMPIFMFLMFTGNL